MLNLIRDQGLIDRLSERSRWPKRASPYPAVLFQRNLRLVVSAMRTDWHSFVGEVHTSYPGFKDCGEQRSPISPASSRRACHSRERSLLCRCGLLCTLFLSKQSAPGVRWSCKVDVSSEIQSKRDSSRNCPRNRPADEIQQRDPFHTRSIQIFISPLEATSSQAEEQMSHAWDIPCESKSDLQYSKLSCRLVAIQLKMRFTWIS